jgi:predicted metal-dependent phosphoesterase TrpH
MTRRYDLHSHTTASDGTLAPADLIDRAASAGIDVLAVTDHDTTAGLAEAAGAATACGISLIPGVEISVSWRHQTVHILGLNIDPACRALQQGLAGLQAYRVWRAEEIGRRLARCGIPDATVGARRHAAGVNIGRTHFARYLVEAGHAADVRKVFKRFLVRGKPGYVPGEWTTLAQALDWIHAAGGDAVIAHPGRYALSGTRLKLLISEFRDGGGRGLEVISGSHTRDQVAHIGSLARGFDMAASCGSDYHGPENPWMELGRLPALPDGCRPVWDEWTTHRALARAG